MLKYLARNHPIVSKKNKFNLKMEKSIITSYLFKMHEHGKFMVLGPTIWKLHAKLRKQLTLKITVKHIYLTSLSTWLNDVSKVLHFEEITELNSNSLSLKMKVKYIGNFAVFWYTNFVCQHSFIRLPKMALLGHAVCSYCISWQPDWGTWGRLSTEQHDTIQFDSVGPCKNRH